MQKIGRKRKYNEKKKIRKTKKKNEKKKIKKRKLKKWENFYCDNTQETAIFYLKKGEKMQKRNR